MKGIRVLLISILIIMSLSGCADQQLGQVKTEVMITRDFGNQKLNDKVISAASDMTVMEVMEENFEIETAYGGGFINGIDGLRSGFTNENSKKKVDWFYYINGVLAQVGADDYNLGANDLIQWDYHDWGNEIYINSIIGAYPKNLIFGHGQNAIKTQILYMEGYIEESQQIASFLEKKGSVNVEVQRIDAMGLTDEECSTILIGPWNELSQIEFVQDAAANKSKSGMFFEIDQQVNALNFKGETAKVYPKGAVITSVLKDYGTMSTVWLVTGNDSECIKRAARLLYENPDEIRGAFSVIVSESEIQNIPFME